MLAHGCAGHARQACRSCKAGAGGWTRQGLEVLSPPGFMQVTRTQGAGRTPAHLYQGAPRLVIALHLKHGSANLELLPAHPTPARSGPPPPPPQAPPFWNPWPALDVVAARGAAHVLHDQHVVRLADRHLSPFFLLVLRFLRRRAGGGWRESRGDGGPLARGCAGGGGAGGEGGRRRRGGGGRREPSGRGGRWGGAQKARRRPWVGGWRGTPLYWKRFVMLSDSHQPGWLE